MSDTFIQLLTGNGTVAFLNLIAIWNTGISIVKWAKDQWTKHQKPQELLADVVFGSACDVLLDRFRKENLLALLQAAAKKGEWKAYAHEADLSQFFIAPPCWQSDVLEQYYQRLFDMIKQEIQANQLLSCSHEALECVFNGIVTDALSKYDEALNDALITHEHLKLYYEKKSIEASSQQMEGINQKIDNLSQKIAEQKVSIQTTSLSRPKVYSGADIHLTKQRVSGQYWDQIISFYDGEHMSARPASDDSEYTWWTTLEERLSSNPIFLTGLNGMGKTAFLAYLYDSVQSGWSTCPFSGVFLLSLDTLITMCPLRPDSDGTPLSDVANSALLWQIARRSENDSAQEFWKRSLAQIPNESNKPILLLLDGLNEMILRQPGHEELFAQIMGEIAALSSKCQYPSVCMILSSCVESADELYTQVHSLPTHFQQATLCGIQNTIHVTPHLTGPMRKLLERPMYYRYIKNCLEQGNIPITEYHLLKGMYSALAEQMINSVRQDKRPYYYAYILEFLLPILAYHELFNHRLTKEAVQTCCIDVIKRWIPLISTLANHNPPPGQGYQRILQKNDFCPVNGYKEVLNEVRNYPRHAQEIIDYLTQAELLFSFEDGTYIFRHQSYRDFLVAEYFIQRMEYMKNNLNADCWKDEENIRSLQINTYGKNILRLIYQAVDFPNDFIQKFQLHSNGLNTMTFSPGCVLWYTFPYQLLDLHRLAGITCSKDQLSKLDHDTLQILHALTKYVRQVSTQRSRRGHPVNNPLRDLCDLLKQNLTEILMKACELLRNQSEYAAALEITEAAKCLFDHNDPGATKTQKSMDSVIGHNIAKIELCKFLEDGDPSQLEHALSLHYRCAVGTESISPYRFSCTQMAQLLVSPHPKLVDQPEFQKFMRQLDAELGGTDTFVQAFWFYYDALFESRKPGETWMTRIYPLRQLLFMLAEHKVRADPEVFAGYDLNNFDIFALGNLPGDPIIAADSSSPIPPMENLQLIRCFLKEIEYLHVTWYRYLEGLAALYLDEDRDTALASFRYMVQKAGDPTSAGTRSRLWLAYMEGDRDALERAHREGWELANQRTDSSNVLSYHSGKYYERDITTLFLYLDEHLSSASATE